MSASWDDDRDGSGLGVDEFNKNIGSLKEGLSRTKGENIHNIIVLNSILFKAQCIHMLRSLPFKNITIKENAILREKMAGLSEDEIQRAIDGQVKREKSQNKKDAWME